MRPKVLIDNGSYGMQNLGDAAMLQVATERFGRLWPEAEVMVVTNRPDRLRRVAPRATPVPTFGHLFGPAHRIAAGIERRMVTQAPLLATLLLKSRTKLLPFLSAQRDMDDFAEIIDGTQLVMTSGGGYMTDSFDFFSIPILQTLELAQQMGKTTAVVGQGVGPLAAGGSLMERCEATFPHLDLIAVRERLAGPKLLSELGVDPDRVVITGDDAIELARRHAPARVGDAIGVNVRRTSYSELGQDISGVLRSTLTELADEVGAPLVPLPVSVSNGEADHQSIGEIFENVASFEDDAVRPRQSHELIERTARCRVVMTGSFHAGVFALSCGIPAVCIARSRYYQMKMNGLADLFGEGCYVVEMEKGRPSDELPTVLREAWERSEDLRPGLLEAADQQIQQGRDAYAKLVDLARDGT